jgi:ribonuclease E
MTKKMLVDATHPEETRVAMVDGNWLSDFDFERTSKKQLKGNIYLAKVIRIEPSLQAAFVEYGGNRHGFLPFSEIHPDYFRIPMADRPHDEIMDDETEVEEEEDLINAEENAAYAADMADVDVSHHDHTELHLPLEEAVGTSQDALAAAIESDISSEASRQSGEFDVDVNRDPVAADDHGLITDFGNAAVDPVTGAEAAPIETIGGEAVEVERIRRQPRPRYKIQEVVKRRQVMLIQVVKEERGNKGAALTTFLSLAGRYCVLMPNTDHGGGVSRKITSHQDRRRMKEILDQLEIPEGMAVILRTAGMEKDPPEIQRDLEYLLRLWNNIREQTLQSTAPTLIYEEANLIKRSMRDLYSHDLHEILVAGQKGYQIAIDFMRTIMPDHLDKVKLYEDPIPLFFRYNVEKYIDQLYSPVVQLRSGGYIVINPTEALVSIDVNSGRATRERHIESTAVKTNLEAAEEIARQLRLRDLAGLVVIDFIDMEDGRNNAAVERRVKDCMKADRARLQIGRISPFGLLELSRQRLHPSLMEINFEKCPHCTGIGLVRSVDSAAISILRVIEEEAIRQGATELVLHIPTKVALYILNQKRESLVQIEQRYNLQVLLHSDDALVPPDYRLERVRNGTVSAVVGPAVNTEQVFAESDAYNRSLTAPDGESQTYPPRESAESGDPESAGGRRRGRFGAGGRNRNRPQQQGRPQNHHTPHPAVSALPDDVAAALPDDTGETQGNISGDTNSVAPDGANDPQRRGRRRGRRGGRGRRNMGENPNAVPHEGVHANGENNSIDPVSSDNRRPNAPPRNDRNQGQGGGQRRDRDQQPRGNWSRPRSDFADGNTVPNIPQSVHELDTTPREPASRQGSGSSQGQQTASAGYSPYEVVSQQTDSDKPKGGWWRRLTGQ